MWKLTHLKEKLSKLIFVNDKGISMYTDDGKKCVDLIVDCNKA